MRSLVALLAVLCFSALAPLRAQSAADVPDKYWVFFTDKGGAGKTQPPIRVETRTLTRRMARGRSTGWEDVPVAPEYLDRVRAIAPEILVQSRWLNAISVRADEAQLSQLRKLPFVREVRRVGSLPKPSPARGEGALPDAGAAAKTTALDYGNSFRQLAFVNAIRLLEEGVNGTGVRIGFLDTRFDFDHPAMRHVQDEGRLIEVRDFTGPNQDVFGGGQSNFHGLNVSSIAVGYAPGNLIGPAYGAEVLAATTEFAPTETNQEEDNFVAGLEWLESEGVDVVNVSLGYTTFDQGQHSYTQDDMDGDTGITTIAADMAASLGVVMVVSAGNEGSSNWRIIGTPADGDSVIAIGAATPDSLRASFSSLGPTADGRTKPDVSALGTSVVVAHPSGGFVSGSGTSFSSPMVAGVVAQMLQVNPALTPAEVLEILRMTANRSTTPDNQLGWGIVNAFAAVEEARMRGENLPKTITVRSPYPNPFNDSVTFELVGPLEVANARIVLYDALGREVDVVFDGPLEPGTNVLPYRASGLASGVYFYRLESGARGETGALVLVR